MKRAFHPLDPRSAPTRLAVALVVGLVAWFVAGTSEFPFAIRILIAWNVAATTLFVLASIIIVRADSTETRRRAAAYDPGRLLVWVVVLAASAVSLLAAIVVLHQAKTLSPFESKLLLCLCVGTVATSWMLTHTGFALRYAHLYYRGGRHDEGGLTFPGESASDPDDFDFVYYAFTIGMCFQVSDVSVTSRVIRRTTLLHGLLSFLYNTGILAFSINVVISQLS